MSSLLALGSVLAGFACGYVYRWRGVPFVGRWRSPFVGKAPSYAIGLYTGASLSDLAEASDVSNPVLTAEAVTDVRASFIADPFLFRNDDTWFMFMEVMNRSRRTGEIGCAVSSDGLEWSYQSIVLREPFHLSYPYVFECDGEIWMIPETASDSSVRLYRATDFPRTWAFQRCLLEGLRFTDASVFQHDGLWWMFVSCNVSRDLLLYYADDLTGPWHSHSQSPVVYARPDKARCAGRPVNVGGRLIRFAQDCGTAYGAAVRAFEVDRLDREGFSETELAGSPILRGMGEGWNENGMHHVDLHVRPDGSYLAAVDGWHMTRAVGLKY